MDKHRYTFGSLLDRVAASYPNNTAIVEQGKRIGYAEFKELTDTMAAGLLDYGLQKGDRVALLMDNRLEWLIVQFAVTKAGGILVPINIRYRPHELDFVLGHSKPAFLIFIDQFLNTSFIDILLHSVSEDPNRPFVRFPSIKHAFCLGEQAYAGTKPYQALLERGARISSKDLRAAVDRVDEQDIAQIIYTSGSTAAPKGAMLTHHSLCKHAEAISNRMHIQSDDRFWIPIPLSFSFACANAIMNAIASGAALILQRVFDPGKALELIASERCTVMYANSTIYLPMAGHSMLKDLDISFLKKGIAMGTPQNIKVLIHDMGVKQICTAYGMTETTAISTLSDPLDAMDVRVNANGFPFPEVTVIVKNPDTGEPVKPGEIGELRVKGYNVMKGYWDDPEKTREAFDEEGFLKTGDMGIIRDDGCAVFKGRYKDMLKTSGINVSTLEVESFIETHPGIESAYVVGIPDELKEEVGVAYLKSKEGLSLTEKDILDFCKGRIGSYKIPKVVRFVSEFPLTGSGKVKKQELREMALNEFKKKD
ncbi:MAG: AMP-binding protein [SAR324 cluster bacterium]|nr:AMP-binding protein [SAR324 cluster bacterium]